MNMPRFCQTEFAEKNCISVNPSVFRALLQKVMPCLLMGALSVSSVLAQPYSLWDNSVVPAIPAAADPDAVEVGLRFQSSVNGTITGIRFYKGPGNTGTHVGNLWTSSGTLLGSVVFTGETDSGWQQQALPAIAIQSNTTYVVSYHAPNGMYSANVGYFAATGFSNPPLRALADGEDGANGVYVYGSAGTFPTETFNSANYWVDVVFQPEEIANPCDGDTNAPALKIPGDVIMACAKCDTDPSNTGIATATDECTVTVKYEDAVLGECPKVVKRTWTATDGAGNKTSRVQTITCVPPTVMTDSAGCSFDRDLSTAEPEFRLLFHPDPQNRPCERLTASNPGQFRFNAFYIGSPGEKITLNLQVPYPFVTQGAKPIQAYDWVTVTQGKSQTCFVPGKSIAVNSQIITLADYAEPSKGKTVSVNVVVPKSGVVYVTMHLDFGLKKTTGYRANAAGDALDCATGEKVLVPNRNLYQFAVSGAVEGRTGIRNYNDFKSNSGVAGLKINNPRIKNDVARASLNNSGRFGFTVTGPDEQVFIVEACADLNNPVWVPIQTNVISGGTFEFTEPRRTGSPSGYYRVRVP